jgi:hypothetical protein
MKAFVGLPWLTLFSTSVITWAALSKRIRDTGIAYMLVTFVADAAITVTTCALLTRKRSEFVQ